MDSAQQTLASAINYLSKYRESRTAGPEAWKCRVHSNSWIADSPVLAHLKVIRVGK